jgi:hypothetical protein
MSIAEMLDRLSPTKKLAQKLDDVWTVIGRPYDFLVNAVG